MSKIKHILPGLILSISVAVIAKILARFFPTLGAATIAILLGILLGNFFFKQPIWENGTKFSEGRLLEISIFFLGSTLSFKTLLEVGASGVIFIILQMAITITAAIFIGKKLQFKQAITLLMASGNAVCGSSAVAATAPAIQADEESKGLVITIVNLMGTILMLMLPLLALFLYNQEPLQTAPLIGGTLQSVGQIVASGSMVSQEVLDQAVIFKIIRIIFLVVVVMLLGRVSSGVKKADTPKTSQPFKLTSYIPWYIIAFFIACLFNSLSLIPEGVSDSLKTSSSWLEITALAAIGLRLNLSALLSQGKKFIYYGVMLGTVQVVSAIFLIFLFF